MMAAALQFSFHIRRNSQVWERKSNFSVPGVSQKLKKLFPLHFTSSSSTYGSCCRDRRCNCVIHLLLFVYFHRTTQLYDFTHQRTGFEPRVLHPKLFMFATKFEQPAQCRFLINFLGDRWILFQLKETPFLIQFKAYNFSIVPSSRCHHLLHLWNPLLSTRWVWSHCVHKQRRK